MKKKICTNRNYGIDLLRIVSMYMVVVLHILNFGGVLQSTDFLSMQHKVAMLLEVFCYCAVNIYALISGYVGIDLNFTLDNIKKNWHIVLFYSISISALFMIIRPGSVTVKEMILSFFPVLTGKYWYFSSYVLLFS